MSKFKIGEKVFVKRNLDISLGDADKEGPGTGYEEIKDFNESLTIKEMINNTTCYPKYKGDIYFFEEIKYGIFEFTLESIPEPDTIEIIDDNLESIKDLMNIFK